MIRIAICDDDPTQLELSRKIICASFIPPDFETETFPSGDKLISSMEKSGYKPDIAVLDIDMPGKSGIETAKALNLLSPSCSVIFLTAFLNYACDVYDVKHCYFILKSQIRERIVSAVHKALEEISSEERIVIKGSGEVTVLPLSELMYIERNLKKTSVFDIHGHEYICYTKPEELLSNIDCRDIIQCHKSYFVNLSHVKALSSVGFTLEDDTAVPISRSKSKEAKEAFYRFLASNLTTVV